MNALVSVYVFGVCLAQLTFDGTDTPLDKTDYQARMSEVQNFAIVSRYYKTLLYFSENVTLCGLSFKYKAVWRLL